MEFSENIEKLIKEWNEFTKFEADIMPEKILKISEWQNRFTILMISEQYKRIKLNSKLRSLGFAIQEKILTGQMDYKIKTVDEKDIYLKGDPDYNNLLVEIEETITIENLFKDLLKTAREIQYQLQRYIDYKKEFGI